MRRRDFCQASLVGGAAVAFAGSWTLARGSGTSNHSIPDLPAVRLDGTATAVPGTVVRDLAAALRGEVLIPGRAGYEQARRIWNGMIDRRPALIARCMDAADVARAVAFAGEQSLLLAVRGGGHSFPGHSACDGGLMIDLSMMKAVQVDPVRRVVRAEGGAWGADVDAATQRHGLATPLGEISNTGIAGLTLGGGFGWLSRRFGLACDNLRSVELVTADGRQLHVSEDENAELFWALRGGGGNFGIVTTFEYRLHPVGPKVLAGYVAHPIEATRSVLQLYGDLAATAPRELSADLGLGMGLHGQVGATIYACWCGEPEPGKAAMDRLTRFGKPVAQTIREQPYVELQKMFDGPEHSPMNHYLKGGFVRELSPGLVAALAEDFHPDATFDAYFQNAGGAVGDVAQSATAFPHRRALANMLLAGQWPNAVDNDRNRDVVRANWARVAQYTEGHYANLSEAGQAADGAYGSNYARLAATKAKYDPRNLFRLNANIRPAT